MILDGVTVLDMSEVVAGPTCAMYLGDLGANVIKIERYKYGDNSRTFEPFKDAESCIYLACNRNKRSISLNTKTDKGREVLYRLVEKADIVIENFTTGDAEKNKIDYETLRKYKPDLIHCSISSFGRIGPLAKKRGYDGIAQAYGGLMAQTGPGPEYPPVRAGYSVSDVPTGIISAFGILAALIYRQQTGQGQFIDTNLLTTQITLSSYYSTGYLAVDDLPIPMGSRHPSFSPYQAFKARDGYIMIGILNEVQWNRLCSVPYFQQLKDEPLYANNESRMANNDKLFEEMESIIGNFDTAKIVADLDHYKVTNSPVNNMKQIFADPWMLENMMTEMTHPTAGQIFAPRLPFRTSAIEPVLRSHSPLVGEHSREILVELGYSGDQIDQMINSRVVYVNESI